VNGTRKERREKLGWRCLGRSVLILVHCTRLYAGKDGVSTDTWRENQARASKDISINRREIVETTKQRRGEEFLGHVRGQRRDDESRNSTRNPGKEGALPNSEFPTVGVGL